MNTAVKTAFGKVYLMNSYSDDIRPKPATIDEIAEVIAGHSTSRLAYIRLDDDGVITATPLNDIELMQLRVSLEERQTQALRSAMNTILATAKSVEGITGIWFREALHIWPAQAPWAEAVVRTWASECGLTCHDESPPTKGETWIRTMKVTIAPERYGTAIINLQWPSIDIGETAIAIECMSHAVAAVGSDTPF